MDKVKVGIVGSQFAAMLHAESYRRCLSAHMVAVAAIDNLEEFGGKYDIPNRYDNYRKMFDEEELDMISTCVPNFLHKEVVLAALRLKRLANDIGDAISGRAVHPISCIPGGFTKLPTEIELIDLRKKLVEEALSIYPKQEALEGLN